MNSFSPTRLVVRADDAGSFVSANQAIEQCIDAGLVRNVSVMVPGPAFEDAARRFAGRDDVCFGLHITLNAEFPSPRWGSVAPPETVSSLLDENGHFLATPTLTSQRGFVVEEAMREIEAQLERAREAGLKLSYVDEHMGVSRIGLRRQIADLCQRERLMDVHGLGMLPLGTTLDTAHSVLETASPGDYVWITHPNLETPDTLPLHPYNGSDDGSFIRSRDAERQLLLHPQLPALFHDFGVATVRYSDL
jgi:hypothetical protein